MVLAEAQTSLKRIEEFLLDPQTHDAAAFDGEADSIFTKEAIGIEMHDAVLQYSGHDGHGFKLSVPRFDVRPGEVVAIVGRVGAGKTAMLDALLGNMPIKGGHVRVGGRIAYVPQVLSLPPTQSWRCCNHIPDVLQFAHSASTMQLRGTGRLSMNPSFCMRSVVLCCGCIRSGLPTAC